VPRIEVSANVVRFLDTQRHLEEDRRFWELFQRFDSSMAPPDTGDKENVLSTVPTDGVPSTKAPHTEPVSRPSQSPTLAASHSPTQPEAVYAETNIPVVAPSMFPTSSPTSVLPPGSIGTKCPGEGFKPIKDTTFAKLLTPPCGVGPSVCEAPVELPFAFPFMGQEYTVMYASPNGVLRFYPDCSDCGGIAASEKYTVAHESYEGDIWIRRLENFITVSWENVNFDDFNHTNFNEQMTLYPNGNVELCWGRGWTFSPVRARIWDDRNRGQAFPVDTGPPFEADGSFTDWPTEQCRFFRSGSNSPGWYTAQSCAGDTCETATPIEAPFHGSAGLTTGEDNDVISITCSDYQFDSKMNDLVWYKVQGDGSCSCVELRSLDNAFIVGIFATSGLGGCDSLSCVSATDFTSHSIVWRTEAKKNYWIAVSAFPSSNKGTCILSVVGVDTSNANCPEAPDSSAKVPGSCLLF